MYIKIDDPGTEELKDLKKNLLWNQKIFTGESKPNVIRYYLPRFEERDAEQLLISIKEEIEKVTEMAKAKAKG